MTQDNPKPAAGSLRTLLTSSAWMIGMRWGMRGIGLISTVILARLLAPADFGVVAIGMIVVGFVEVFSFLGVDLALIRNREATRDHYDTAWTIGLLQGGVVAGVLLCVAPFVGDIFQEPRAVAVTALLAVRAGISGFENIGTVDFRKELNFAKEFRYGVYKKLANFTATIVLAFWLQSYWALVLGVLIGRIFEIGISYGMHRYRPRPCLKEWRSVWSFSKWLVVTNVLVYMRNRVDEFVVARVIGTTAMGNYHVAAYVATAPSEELAMPLARALFPNYALLAGNAEKLVQSYLSVLRVLTPIAVSIGFGITAVAGDLVLLFLGDKWHAAIPLVAWLGFSASLAGVTNTAHTPMMTIGRVRFLTILNVAHLALLAAVVVAGALTYGLHGVVMARALVAVVAMPLVFIALTAVIPVRLGQILEATWRPVFAGAVMIGVVRLCHQPWIELLSARLAMDVAIGAATFAAVSLATWWASGRPDGLERLVLRILKRRGGHG